MVFALEIAIYLPGNWSMLWLTRQPGGACGCFEIVEDINAPSSIYFAR
jgi:hypothetical protein